MNIIASIEVAAELAPQLPSEATLILLTGAGAFEGDPARAEIFFRWFTPRAHLEQVLEAAPMLRWVHTPSAGVDHVLIPQLKVRDIVVTNSAGMHAIPIAEFVLAFMLNHAKGMAVLQAAQAEHRWIQHYQPRELYGATLLIIGIGGIGGLIAERASAFGMRVVGSRRHPQPMPGVERVVGAAEWRDLLPEADYVVIATPLTPLTRGLIDASVLRAMRPDAYLINIARGEIVDEAALIQALRERWIAGAALDTVAHEPLSPDSQLWDLPNIVITPHATAHSPRMRERAIALFLENLQRYCDGQPLLNVVDKQAGY